MNFSGLFTASLTALAIAGSTGMAFAQSNTSGSPASPAPAAANQTPSVQQAKPMKKARTKAAATRTTPRATGSNTSDSPASPAPAAANQQPSTAGSAPMTGSSGSMSNADRTPAKATGSNTSGSPASPAPAAANQAPPAAGSTPAK